MADAFPFTVERLEELKKKMDDVAKGWPEKLRHELHDEHELVLMRIEVYSLMDAKIWASPGRTGARSANSTCIPSACWQWKRRMRNRRQLLRKPRLHMCAMEGCAKRPRDDELDDQPVHISEFEGKYVGLYFMSHHEDVAVNNSSELLMEWRRVKVAIVKDIINT
ncbi:hypothetical protein EJB05_06159, partial [Eragrostis curvula]